MRFLQQRRLFESVRARSAVVLVLGGAVVCAIVQPAWLTRATLTVAGNLFVVRSVLADSVDGVLVGMRSIREVVDENKQLREENTKLRVRAALYDEVHATLNRLSARFGRENQTTGTLAHVIAGPSRSPYDTFLVDVGNADGVHEGDEAWFDTTLALGTLEQVSEHTARVRLYSSPGVETPVSVGTTSTALFTATGFGGGSFEINVPKDSSVAVNDALILSRTGQGTLGFVVGVTAHDADSFKTVYATMPINLFETREVLIRPRM